MKSLKIYTIIKCKDCHAFHEMVDEICDQLNITRELIDIDIEDNLKTNLEEMVKHKIMGIPYTIVYTDGVSGRGMQGILNKEQLLELINYV